MANKYPCFAVTNPHMPIMHPNSFEVIPWVNFTSNINSFFNSSFVHNKLLNVNYMFTTPRTAFLFAHEFAHKKYINLSAVAHCKLLSSRGSILFTMLNDKFDVQAASDEVNIEGDAFKIDALVSSRKNFDEQVWRLGLHYRSTLGSTQNLRLRYCGQTNNLSIGNKSMTISGNWKFSNLLIYDWTQQWFKKIATQIKWLNITQHGKQISFTLQSADEVTRIKQKTIWKDLFGDSLTINGIYKLNNQNIFGLQVIMSPIDKLKETHAVLQYHHPQTKTIVKLKASLTRKLALSIRNSLGTYGSYIFGMEISDIGRTNKCNSGVQIDLNI